jgi:hypothetical protein
MMRARLLLLVFFVAVLGCSSKKLAPVSGRVTLNGKPLANATVSFQPIAEGKSPDAGAGSTGKTDEDGRFTLKTSTGQEGAVVGKHRVRISALETQVGDSDERAPRGGWPQGDKVPKRYNSESNETFDVLRGGTDKADFPLKSP